MHRTEDKNRRALDNDEELLGAFRDAVKTLEEHRRTLAAAKSDSAVQRALSSIVRFLHSQTPTQALKIMYGSRQKEANYARRLGQAPELASASLEEVERLLAASDTNRATLESIAVGRFQVPRGSLKSLGNMEELRERIATLIRNERAHATISEVARHNKN